MRGFIAQRFWFTVEVEEPIEWYPFKGPSIRGALFGALRRHYCFAPGEPDPAHSAVCPVCWLLSREDPHWGRGHTPPRPYTIEPPLETKTRYEPGESFSFGITLFGQATNLFPYLVLAVPEMGRAGIGRKGEQSKRRGRFSLSLIEEMNPLTGQRRKLLGRGERMVQAPQIPVSHEQVVRMANHRMGEGRKGEDKPRLEIRFLTPTRIGERRAEGKRWLVNRPLFAPFFRRLVERLEALSTLYGGGPPDWDRDALLALAEGVRLVEDRTRWVDIKSFSRRLGRPTPVSGFLGEAVYEAEDWRPLLPWLIWGMVTHVGKDAVKGNGWYRISEGANQ